MKLLQLILNKILIEIDSEMKFAQAEDSTTFRNPHDQEVNNKRDFLKSSSSIH